MTTEAPKPGSEDEFYRTFGELMFSQRKKMGLSQEKAADLIGTSQASICRMELGNMHSDIFELIKIAYHLEINLFSVLGKAIKNG